MDRLNPGAALSVHALTVHNALVNTYSSPENITKLSSTREEQLEWKWLPGNSTPSDSPECWYFGEDADKSGKALRVRDFYFDNPDFLRDPRYHALPEDNSTPAKWKKCHLLSLPRNIRIKIWTFVLGYDSVPDITVNISRVEHLPYYKLTRPPVPKLAFYHSPSKKHAISTALLYTNRRIYKEALPILYANITFQPADLEGLLPIFLNSLSAHARSCIRHVRLPLPAPPPTNALVKDRSRPLFHWAVSCAQVASLNYTLQDIEVAGNWDLIDDKANRRAILYPLCKIKAAKRFVPQGSAASTDPAQEAMFQELLQEAEDERLVNAKRRDATIKAGTMEPQRAAEATTQIQNPRTPTFNPDTSDPDNSMETWARWAEENIKRMERNMGLLANFEQSGRNSEHEYSQDGPPNYEDLDWDLLSVTCAEDMDAAATASDMESDEWEYISE